MNITKFNSTFLYLCDIITAIDNIRMKKITIFSLLALLCMGCGEANEAHDGKTIFVTITPLRSLVEEITCGDFDVEVLVPDGASPETYEPTARQLTALNDAQRVFTVGLINFEQMLIANLREEQVVDLSAGIDLMEGSCSHGHKHHSHGIDPHTWTSPRALKSVVRTIERAIMADYPDSTKYREAATELIARIEALDNHCKEQIERSGIEAILIYHPAYTYYARDYGISQIAIEHDGKEPSPRQLTKIIATARDNDIRTILLQPQYSPDKVRAIAEECNAEIVVTNPLSEDILAEIERVTAIICRSDE